MTDDSRPPFPPFDADSALTKVLAAEAGWNTRDPEKVSLAYTPDTLWRNRSEWISGRAEVVDFLTRKWERERDYVLRKALWAYSGNRIAVRFQYECRDADGQWWRCYGNENWEFAENGLMARREASIDDLCIEESQRRLVGPREEGDTSEIPI